MMKLPRICGYTRILNPESLSLLPHTVLRQQQLSHTAQPETNPINFLHSEPIHKHVLKCDNMFRFQKTLGQNIRRLPPKVSIKIFFISEVKAAI